MVGRRGGDERVAACVVRATTRADVNTLVRRLLDVRKATFLPTDRAVAMSDMEYGGITPIGLPIGWRGARATPTCWRTRRPVVVGSGVRRSKILLPGRDLAALGVEAVDGLGRRPSA